MDEARRTARASRCVPVTFGHKFDDSDDLIFRFVCAPLPASVFPVVATGYFAADLIRPTRSSAPSRALVVEPRVTAAIARMVLCLMWMMMGSFFADSC